MSYSSPTAGLIRRTESPSPFREGGLPGGLAFPTFNRNLDENLEILLARGTPENVIRAWLYEIRRYTRSLERGAIRALVPADSVPAPPPDDPRTMATSCWSFTDLLTTTFGHIRREGRYVAAVLFSPQGFRSYAVGGEDTIVREHLVVSEEDWHRGSLDIDGTCYPYAVDPTQAETVRVATMGPDISREMRMLHYGVNDRFLDEFGCPTVAQSRTVRVPMRPLVLFESRYVLDGQLYRYGTWLLAKMRLA